jgi:hypothetical protein
MRGRAILAAVAGVLAIAACAPTDAAPVNGIRQGTQSYLFTITAESLPPHALDSVRYTVYVVDKKTKQPIQGGEGQIFAEHEMGPYTWDGFAYGPGVGAYHGILRFAIQGQWSMALRFRRDSLSPLERVDWIQDVREERPYFKTDTTKRP